VLRRRGRAAYHSPPSGAEVKNEWSYTSTLLICLYVVDRDKFTLLLLLLLITIIQTIYNDTTEPNHVPTVHSVAAVA